MLSPTSTTTLTDRLRRSAGAAGGEVMSDQEFFAWLDGRRAQHVQRVRRIGFGELSGWSFDEQTGNLGHRSGRFFSVQGLAVESDTGPVRQWLQPILSQPEVGILGIAVREINGLLHCLIQAKAEPGNINGVQLSPTVQATKSNYTQVHGGSSVPYVDCFRGPTAGRVLADVLQSEQGAWFYRKRNRNIVVEVGPEVEAGEDFCWLTLRQLNDFLRHDNLLGMDVRTVLSCFPYLATNTTEDGESRHSALELRSWITDRRSEHEVRSRLVPLKEVEGTAWRRTPDAIEHADGRYFSIVAVDIESSHREVRAWSQPLLQPHGLGLAALVVKPINGVPHALMQARAEPGYLDVIELGPTLDCTPENHAHLPEADRPRYLDHLNQVLEAKPEQIRFDTVLSEEGGRFYHAETRYLIIEAGEDFEAETPDDYRWVSLSQIAELLKYSHYVDVQTRTLFAALRAVAPLGDPACR